MGRRGPLKRGQHVRLSVVDGDTASVAGDDSLLTPPDGLPPGAAELYRRLAPILLADKRLLPETQGTLVTYCRLSDESRRIADALEAEGVVRKTPHGTVVDGRCKMLSGLRTALLKFSNDLGLTPAGRARLQSAGVIQAPRTAEEIEADRAFSELLGRADDSRKRAGLA